MPKPCATHSLPLSKVRSRNRTPAEDKKEKLSSCSVFSDEKPRPGGGGRGGGGTGPGAVCVKENGHSCSAWTNHSLLNNHVSFPNYKSIIMARCPAALAV